MKHRSLTAQQSERVVKALRRRLHQLHAGNVSALARDIGVPQPILHRVLSEQHGATMPTAEAIARAEGMAVETILAGPRGLAAQIAKEGGVPETAIARVLAEEEPEEYRTTAWWYERMKAVALLGEGSGEIRVRPQEIPPPSSHRRGVA